MQSRNGLESAILPRRRITPREYQVAELVGRGLSNRRIADELVIAPSTVARHLASIFMKLGITSRSALAFAVSSEVTRIGSYRAAAGSTLEEARSTPPEQIRDLGNWARKPDPLSARTLPELEDHLRSLWAWAGRPSSRTLASRANGAFSHATACKLIYGKTRKPILRLEYVLGLVVACGADEAEQERWATAWRGVTRNPQGGGTPGAPAPNKGRKPPAEPLTAAEVATLISYNRQH
jgi:DNA-binding CsgD family transcriptional regulator